MTFKSKHDLSIVCLITSSSLHHVMTSLTTGSSQSRPHLTQPFVAWEFRRMLNRKTSRPSAAARQRHKVKKRERVCVRVSYCQLL